MNSASIYLAMRLFIYQQVKSVSDLDLEKSIGSYRFLPDPEIYVALSVRPTKPLNPRRCISETTCGHASDSMIRG
ncbi:hypothetical protein QVD17_14916 [Tagetes erecta]|uniref:Uncharacterized protein n=1 Tax=Tagetes erecta TaxID=13708 RepID=A0AAD8KSB1_TARER|nr:hypothetical protein QVD17_14916 [Tagetes erecta]